MMTDHTQTATDIAACLPIRDDESDFDLISLVDIVITGVETPWTHFKVKNYDFDADGVNKPWATLVGLKDAMEEGQKERHRVILTAASVRGAVVKYLTSRLNGGMDLESARQLVDGSYTDAVVADSILQFALYGEEVFG